VPQTEQTSEGRFTGRRTAIAIAVAVAVGLVAWLLLKDGDDNGKTANSRPIAPAVGASVTELESEAKTIRGPMFWAGERAGFTYELTKLDDGSVFVRYLPQGVQVGDPRPNFLTVATYPLPNGYARVLAQSKRPGARMRKLDSGGRALVNRDRPSSVYIAYPRGKYQVEVYDPTPGAALNLAVSEQIRPVG
jgi:hypothetical protein